ncbi:MAG TPA: hypothetical protein VLV83_26070 [Acidobacteriota bacterium]|nr:hypothetical protein [Acidobacteriota bacterium]
MPVKHSRSRRRSRRSLEMERQRRVRRLYLLELREREGEFAGGSTPFRIANRTIHNGRFVGESYESCGHRGRKRTRPPFSVLQRREEARQRDTEDRFDDNNRKLQKQVEDDAWRCKNEAICLLIRHGLASEAHRSDLLRLDLGDLHTMLPERALPELTGRKSVKSKPRKPPTLPGSRTEGLART